MDEFSQRKYTAVKRPNVVPKVDLSQVIPIGTDFSCNENIEINVTEISLSKITLSQMIDFWFGDVDMKHDRIPINLHITKISKHQSPIQLDPI